MPLPHWLMRVNRMGNRVIAPFAPHLRWFGVLEHVGRRSGTVRRTPVSMFRPGPDRYVIALVYGHDVQWLHNVLAAGHCRARTRSRWISLSEPRRFRDPERRDVPRLVRPILAAMRVNEFVELRRVN